MPQLDFSFYISQITWLCISFFGFFCISKFLILPRLESILSNRSNLIEKNMLITKTNIENAKEINKTIDGKILSVKVNIDKNNRDLLNDLKNRNEEKINKLKKKLIESETINLMKLKNDLLKSTEETNECIIDVISELIKKIYLVNADKNLIKKLVDKK